MPVYEYKCKKCNNTFIEHFNTFKESIEKKIKCPFCNSNNIKRIYSKLSFNFKGSGFYETDYKKRI